MHAHGTRCRQGVQVSLGFFDDVHIGHECLPDPSRYKPHEDGGGGEWFWQYEGDEMYLERDDPVRFRVREVRPFTLTLLGCVLIDFRNSGVVTDVERVDPVRLRMSQVHPCALPCWGLHSGALRLGF